MEIEEYPDLVLPKTVTHSFYFKYLLPIWIHVACIVGNNGHVWVNPWVWTGTVPRRAIERQSHRVNGFEDSLQRTAAHG